MTGITIVVGCLNMPLSSLWPCKHIQAELAAVNTLHVEEKKTAIVSESIRWITKLPKKPLGLLISVCNLVFIVYRDSPSAVFWFSLHTKITSEGGALLKGTQPYFSLSPRVTPSPSS